MADRLAPWPEPLEPSEPHPHCESCVKLWKCTVRTPRLGESCEITHCTQGCGARFHACKSSEHRLLCPEEKVPCINAGNGCPLWLLRKHRSRHLERCPASVVHCTMEWNRWPVCSRERQVQIPFQQANQQATRVGPVTAARPGQLDVALALRDQRMLNEWTRAPLKTKRIMKNDLTLRFPAVPLVQSVARYRSEGAQGVVDEGEATEEFGTRWESRKSPPGLQRSMCLELYRANKQANDRLTAALHMITSYGGTVKEQMDLARMCALEDKENVPFLNNWPLLEPMEVEDTRKVGGGEKMDVEAEDDEGVVLDTAEYDVLFVDNTVVSEISSASMTDHARKRPSPQVPPPPPPPPSAPPLFVSLGLDLTLESITRYQTKPSAMYTFLCAQVFRRDEYCWHYKNVHSDIHGGLNGWLEQRCPLAHHGCMHSVRRFYPTSRGSTVVHNDILESFGVRPNVGAPVERGAVGGHEDQKLQLTRLPFEVLQHVARCLDGFSLCNLSMTSRLLREVAGSLLEERGVVVQQWERRRDKYRPGTYDGWHVAYKRWFFSTAFTPVQRWGFENKENMGNHLKKCMYFQRNIKTEPYFYPMGIEPNDALYERLKTDAAAKGHRDKDAMTSTKM